MSDGDARISGMKAGIAAIVGCMVDTMEEMQPGSRETFVRKIGEACAKLKSGADGAPVEDGSHVEAVELVMWTGEMVSGWQSLLRERGRFVT